MAYCKSLCSFLKLTFPTLIGFIGVIVGGSITYFVESNKQRQQEKLLILNTIPQYFVDLRNSYADLKAVLDDISKKSDAQRKPIEINSYNNFIYYKNEFQHSLDKIDFIFSLFSKKYIDEFDSISKNIEKADDLIKNPKKIDYAHTYQYMSVKLVPILENISKCLNKIMLNIKSDLRNISE